MDRLSLIIFCFLAASILFIAGAQSGNEQSKGERSRRASPTAPSEGQKNPPAAHQNSPSNSGKSDNVYDCSSDYASLHPNEKIKACYARHTDRGKPIRCIPGRQECRGG
ncbi:hypothetical protein SLA2020_419700 [Shorea laevis]